MLDKVKEFILKNNLIKPHDKIIVGLSGGPDSICLINILKQLQQEFKLELIAAHLNHEWRSTASDDVVFCQKIAQELDILFISKKASDINLTKKQCGGSKEELGRLLRRQFFESILKKYQANSIALGQQWDDQIETFFIRLIRGSSISGLASIRAKYSYYIRPLLNITKSEILEYLDHNGLQYIKDETNDLDIYLRNKIRKYIVPNLRKIDSRFDKNFKKTLDNIQQADQYLEKVTKSVFNNITKQEDNILWLNKEKFLEVDKYLQANILIMWLCYYQVEFTPTNLFFKEIVRFIEQPGSRKHNIYHNWSIIKLKNYLKIEKS